MLSVDVNVLVYAFDRSSPHHAGRHPTMKGLARSWSPTRASPERLVLFPAVIAGFLRVMTDRRILVSPVEPGVAMDFIDALVAGPSVRVVQPGERHWSIVRELIDVHAPHGPDITDVFMAAAAI